MAAATDTSQTPIPGRPPTAHGLDGRSAQAHNYAMATELPVSRLARIDETDAIDAAMFVRNDWTRRGFGTRILHACETAAAAEGFRVVALVAMLPGVLLYERYGFVASKDVKVTMPDGTTVAAVAMEKPVE